MDHLAWKVAVIPTCTPYIEIAYPSKGSAPVHPRTSKPDNVHLCNGGLALCTASSQMG